MAVRDDDVLEVADVFAGGLDRRDDLVVAFGEPCVNQREFTVVDKEGINCAEADLPQAFDDLSRCCHGAELKRSKWLKLVSFESVVIFEDSFPADTIRDILRSPKRNILWFELDNPNQ